MIDIHMHSTISDGSETIEALIKRANQKQLKLIAITDHDTYHDWSHLSNETLNVVGGMEISAYDYEVSKKVHLLIYGNQLSLKHVKSVICETLSKRHQNSMRQLNIIKDAGYDIDYENLNKSDENILYKQHIMEGLKRKGYTQTLNGDLYQKLFKNNGIAQGDIDYPDVFEVIQAAVKDHVFVVLAHPGLSGVFDRIPNYVKFGLKGIETYHGLATEKIRHQAKIYAKTHQLIETIGSDFHGHYGVEPDIGSVEAPQDISQKLYAYMLTLVNNK